MENLAEQLVKTAEKYHLVMESCAEKLNLQRIGIQHGSCIDRALIERILGCKLKVEKDKNQRGECGCFESVEVGSYDTCPNGCRYCYANFNDEKVRKNKKHYDADSPLLCGSIHPEDKITDRKMKSVKEMQMSLFD